MGRGRFTVLASWLHVAPRAAKRQSMLRNKDKDNKWCGRFFTVLYYTYGLYRKTYIVHI